MLRGAALTETAPGLAAPSAMAIGTACRAQSYHCPALRPAAGGCTLCGPLCRVQPGLLRTCAVMAAPSMTPGHGPTLGRASSVVHSRARPCLRRRGRRAPVPAECLPAQGAARKGSRPCRPSACPHLTVAVPAQGAARAGDASCAGPHLRRGCAARVRPRAPGRTAPATHGWGSPTSPGWPRLRPRSPVMGSPV